MKVKWESQANWHGPFVSESIFNLIHSLDASASKIALLWVHFWGVQHPEKSVHRDTPTGVSLVTEDEVTGKTRFPILTSGL